MDKRSMKKHAHEVERRARRRHMHAHPNDYMNMLEKRREKMIRERREKIFKILKKKKEAL